MHGSVRRQGRRPASFPKSLGMGARRNSHGIPSDPLPTFDPLRCQISDRVPMTDVTRRFVSTLSCCDCHWLPRDMVQHWEQGGETVAVKEITRDTSVAEIVKLCLALGEFLDEH